MTQAAVFRVGRRRNTMPKVSAPPTMSPPAISSSPKNGFPVTANVAPGMAALQLEVVATKAPFPVKTPLTEPPEADPLDTAPEGASTHSPLEES
jgi:hypothetical protein